MVTNIYPQVTLETVTNIGRIFHISHFPCHVSLSRGHISCFMITICCKNMLQIFFFFWMVVCYLKQVTISLRSHDLQLSRHTSCKSQFNWLALYRILAYNNFGVTTTTNFNIMEPNCSTSCDWDHFHHNVHIWLWFSIHKMLSYSF